MRITLSPAPESFMLSSNELKIGGLYTCPQLRTDAIFLAHYQVGGQVAIVNLRNPIETWDNLQHITAKFQRLPLNTTVTLQQE